MPLMMRPLHTQGIVRVTYRICLLILFVLVPIQGEATPSPKAQQPEFTIKTVHQIDQSGGQHLALWLAKRQQSIIPATKIHHQLGWAKVRLELLAQQHAWHQILSVTKDWPESLIHADRHDLLWYQARARIALHQGTSARKVLQRWLWTGGTVPTGRKEIMQARRWLISAYLDEQDDQDARLALLNYVFDYPRESRRQGGRLAAIWLRLGEPAKALPLVDGKPNNPTYWLYLLGRLQSGQWSPAKVLQSARVALRKIHSDRESQAQLWGVCVRAAQRMHHLKTEIEVLQHYLIETSINAPSDLLPYNGDTLWKLYLAYAQDYGRRQHLSMGDDHAWEKATQKASHLHNRTLAIAINALLALKGRTAEGRATGFRWLAILSLKTKHGQRLLKQTFLAAPKQFPHMAAIPVGVRLVLANDAVVSGDSVLAAKLLKGVTTPPPKQKIFPWTLKIAQLLVIGGQSADGEKRLLSLLKNYKQLNRKQMAEFLQDVFTLQNVHHDQMALKIFQRAFKKTNDAVQKRQILFWMAQSEQALRHYRLAAADYLMSSFWQVKNSWDPWGIAARYHAALALAQGEDRSDARRILKSMLPHLTKPAEKKSVLSELARLHSLKDSSTPSPGV